MKALVNISPDGKNFHTWYYEGNQKHYEYIEDFQPYFYGSNKKLGVFPKESELEKIVVGHPSEVKSKREQYNYTAVADVLYVNRFLIDHYYKSEIPKSPFKLCFVDIENLFDEKTKALPNAMQADFPITLLSVFNEADKQIYTFGWHETKHWADDKNKIFVYSTELEALQAFLLFWQTQSFDVVSGWNSNNYDIPYIFNRLKKYGLEKKLSPVEETYFDSYEKRYKIAGVSCLDFMEHCKKRLTRGRESWALDSFAKDVLGRGKTKIKENTNELWKNNIEKLIEYNREDVRLLHELEFGNKDFKGLRFIELADELRRIGRVVFEDTLKSSRIHDNRILCKLKTRQQVAITKPPKEEFNGKHAGAFIKEPVVGIHDWVADLDATALYPSLIIAKNVSPEIKSPNDGKGILPEITEELLALRKEYKDKYLKTRDNSDFLKQWAYKILANSLYGFLGFRGSRLFDKTLAEKVTKAGQKVIKFAGKKVEELGLEVIYMDTDSIFFKLKASDLNEAKAQAKKVSEHVDKSMQEIEKEMGISNSCLSFKLETISDKAIFFPKKGSTVGAKKRYVLHVLYEEGKDVDVMEYKGVSVVRSDTPKTVKPFLKKVYKMVVEGKTKQEIDECIKGFKKELLLLPPKEIALPISITKPLSTYKANSIHVTGARFWNKHFNPKIVEGMKVKYLYIKPNGFGECHVISLPLEERLPKGIRVNYDKMVDRLVDSKVKEVVSLLEEKKTIFDY